jgi:beta-fructofuranosidase
VSTHPIDPHLPAAHLRPPANWINDPNGLAYHDGHYHVFYQYNPYGADHANMHWGHFRSPDLVTWESQPIALTPTPGWHDATGCFSGNAVSHGDRLLAFYSAFLAERWWQPVAVAESRDGGLTWDKHPDLLIPEPPTGTTMYRDPYVWRAGKSWRMLVGAALDDGRGAALLYENAEDAPDVAAWTYRGAFHAAGDDPGEGGAATARPIGWECPQYADFGDRGLLITSLWHPDTGPRSVVAWSGHEHDRRLTAADSYVLDHGPDIYAPAVLRAPDGRWLLWGWSWEARDAQWVQESGWSGVLTVPREITLDEDGRPRQRPAAEIAALRSAHTVHLTGRIQHEDQHKQKHVKTADLGELPRSFDLTARLDASGHAGLRILTNPSGPEYLEIRHDRDTRELIVDRDHASLDERARGGVYRMPSHADGPVELRMIVDHSIAEVFASTGEALTVRFYPSGRNPWRLQTFAAPDARLDYTVDAWELDRLVIKEPSNGTGTPSGTGLEGQYR